MVPTLLEARSDLYRSLALALYRPDEELITAEYLQAFKGLTSCLELDVAAPLQALEELYAGGSLSLKELEIEYSRLFLGPFSLLVPPYESCFREERRAMGETTMAVARLYKKAGFVVDSWFKEPPDHIALELSFLAELDELESKTQAQGNNSLGGAVRALQREFLASHLLLWAGAFQEAVQQKATLVFYPAMARIMVEAVKSHWQRLNE